MIDMTNIQEVLDRCGRKESIYIAPDHDAFFALLFADEAEFDINKCVSFCKAHPNADLILSCKNAFINEACNSKPKYNITLKTARTRVNELIKYMRCWFDGVRYTVQQTYVKISLYE